MDSKIAHHSFSATVKEEIASLSFTPTEQKALLSSFVKSNGMFRLSGGKEMLDLSSESSKVASLLYRIIGSLYGIQCHFAYTRGMGSRKAMRYHCLAPSADTILQDIEVDFFNSKIPLGVVNTPEEVKAYLCGAFLSAGYVSDPKNKNYHLEFSLSDSSYATWLSHLIRKIEAGRFESKTIKRRNQSVVYFKRSDKISEFLAYLGAIDSCYEFESIRVDRDFANIGNRLINLQKANTTKKTSASTKQIDEILFLKENDLIETMSNPKISYLCEMRLGNPDASMEKLAEILSEEMGMSISKSNVNHLFRAIHELYLKHKQGEGNEEAS